MTPVRQDPRLFRPPTVRLAAAALGVLLLVLLFIPARDPVSHALSIEWRPAAVLAALLFLVAVAGAVRPQAIVATRTARILGWLVAALALLNLVDAATPTLLGRDLNLYWDLPHLPSLFGLAGEAAGLWPMAGVSAVLSGAIVLLINGTAWAWRQVLPILANRHIALGFAVVLGVALDVTAVVPAKDRPLATGLALDIVRQSATVAKGRLAATSGSGSYAEAIAAPPPPYSDLAGLKRRDVYLVYLESYGTTVFDTPEFRAGLGDELSQFETSLNRAGYSIVSNRLVSPTFGGGSWLAHATLASGVRLDDPVLYTLLLDSGRKLLPTYFKQAGWRTLEIAPGIKAPSATAKAAWSFDKEVFASELDYKGPSFGWFAIPDQFTLDRAAAIRSALGPAPVFTQLILVSSHIPFAPVPPYLADWDDSGTFATVPATTMKKVWRQPDWGDLAPDYLRSLRYDFAALTGWLTSRITGNGLVILLGDHQPPALVGGLPQPPWTVPIHVLSRDPDLIAPFLAEGYVSGLFPTQPPPHPGMEAFLARFLAAFERPRPG